MTARTPDDALFRSEDLFSDVLDSLEALRDEIRALKGRIETGEDIGAAKASLAQVEPLLRTCLKVESNLVELRNRQSGIAQAGHALDFVAIRDEIGCRLARLAERGCPGRISE